MARGRKTGGRSKGTPNKRTVAKLAEVGKVIHEARKSKDVVRAKEVLSDLTKTAVGFTGYYQAKMMAFDADPKNAGKLPPAEVVDRFMWGLDAAVRAAKALAPYQDPTFAAIKVSMSPLDSLDAPKTIEGKATKIDTKDPIELARIYSQLVRAA